VFLVGLNLKGILRLLQEGRYCHLKKRETIRIMHTLSLVGTRQLATEVHALRQGKPGNDDHGLLIANYLNSSLIYCLNEDMITGLKATIQESLKEVVDHFDLDQTIEDLYPFGLYG
jgi:hypothetical protein